MKENWLVRMRETVESAKEVLIFRSQKCVLLFGKIRWLSKQRVCSCLDFYSEEEKCGASKICDHRGQTHYYRKGPDSFAVL